MELIDLLRVVRRWLWLIIAIVVVTELALWLGTRSAEPVYAASVKLQFSTPQREDVAAYDEYRSISLRDEIAVAINNFIELSQSSDVQSRTISKLDLNDQDANYAVTSSRTSDADFIKVTIEARKPDLAAEIANAHVDIAITYYGELRAQSTKAEKDFFAEQLRAAEEEFQAAEKALADFRTHNGIYSLESQMATQQKLLEQLQLERDQRILEQATTIITKTNDTIPDVTIIATPVIDLVGEVDKLIVQRQKELEQFTALAPQYDLLDENVEQARDVYQHLLGKYSEAELKVTAVQAANFIQVVRPAYAPVESESGWPKLAVLALAGSLGLGVMLAFFFQYISGSKTVSDAAPVSDHKTSSHKSADTGIWKRFRNIFRQNSSNHKHLNQSSAEIDVENEVLSAQEQHETTGAKVA